MRRRWLTAGIVATGLAIAFVAVASSSEHARRGAGTVESTPQPPPHSNSESSSSAITGGALPSVIASGADHHVRATAIEITAPAPMSELVEDKSNACDDGTKAWDFPPCDESGNTTVEWTDRIYESGKYRRATIRVEEVLKGPWPVGSEHTFYYLSSCRTCGDDVVGNASSDGVSGYPHVAVGAQYFLTLIDENHRRFEGQRSLSAAGLGLWKVLPRPGQDDLVERVQPPAQGDTVTLTVSNYRAQVACPEMMPPDPAECDAS